MRRRAWFLLALAIAGLLALVGWGLWPAVGEVPEAVVADAELQVVTRSVERRSRPVVVRPVVEPENPLESDAPLTDHEEALFAAITHSGEGFVRCVLPADLEVDLDRLNWAGKQGNVLTMATETPDGSTLLYAAPVSPSPDELTRRLAEVDPARRPALSEELESSFARRFDAIGDATWTDAPAGERGDCTVRLAVDRVEVSVVVLMPSGEPAVGAHGGVRAAAFRTDESGRSTVSVFPGHESMIHASYSTTEGDRFNGYALLPADTPESVTIPLKAAEPVTAFREVEGLASLLQRSAEDGTERHDSPLRAALAEPGLSVGAKAQLDAWLDRSADNLDQQYDNIDRMEWIREGD